MLLPTTTGRKSGERRTRPVGHLPDRGRFLACGSNGGLDHPPAWSLNPRASRFGSDFGRDQGAYLASQA